MSDLKQKIISAFEGEFEERPSHYYRAPGRVNLIGEHTDYNDGFVLPCAIDYEAGIAAGNRSDGLVKVLALDYTELDSFELAAPIANNPNQQWANYVRGVANSLIEHGHVLKGCNLVISGNVPQGAGLSSSAALEVAVANALMGQSNLEIDPKDAALIGQHAENNFVGCQCGIMDQLISAKGEEKHALLIDCRSLDAQLVKMPQDIEVLIINSNVKRGLVDSEYNIRREQCEQAAQFFGKSHLRDVTLEEYQDAEDQMDPVVSKRARHIITENLRTLNAAAALAISDYGKLSELMAQSHLSMKDDFEITVPQIDYLVEIIAEELGLLGGVRMTGGGFGGCVVALVPSRMVGRVIARIEKDYQPHTGLTADIYQCSARDGASAEVLT